MPAGLVLLLAKTVAKGAESLHECELVIERYGWRGRDPLLQIAESVPGIAPGGASRLEPIFELLHGETELLRGATGRLHPLGRLVVLLIRRLVVVVQPRCSSRRASAVATASAALAPLSIPIGR